MTSPADDFRPTASWANLKLRADLLRRLRDFFHERGFLEVETPLLSADVVVDRHLDPLAVLRPGDEAQSKKRLWLQTSPEFGMKRLMAAGGEAIYQITRAFRAGETGRLHNPEFTMVEWYRRGDSMAAGMQLLSDVAETLFGLGAANPISYAAAFQQFAGVDPHRAAAVELAALAAAKGISVSQSFGAGDRDAWLHLLLAELIEPHLGIERPAILYDYPASQAALAQVRPGDPPLAERFELYVRGIELANGYHELVDANELRRRFATANRQRTADGKATLPEESRLLAAMESGLPDCTGVALGFDRAVMLVLGAKSLAEVMAFPIELA